MAGITDQILALLLHFASLSEETKEDIIGNLTEADHEKIAIFDNSGNNRLREG